MNIRELRTQFPVFSYVSARGVARGDDVVFSFEFRLGDAFIFRPITTIRGVGADRLAAVSSEILQHFAFQAGLAEMLSYWKLACSPQILIEAGSLSSEQIVFWKDLLLNGMGEFFYVNDIDFTAPDFVSIVSEVSSSVVVLPRLPYEEDTYLIPLGGGKDSIVTLELLKKFVPSAERVLFSVNPTQAEDAVAKKSGIKPRIIVERRLDPKLFDLNTQGFLNGHTPFSSVLAFLSVITASLTGLSHVAISQERSSNEGNVVFYGAEINHQYSKSFVFEKKFREYAEKFLCEGVNFFSFLRPLYEVQIAKIFVSFPDYFFVFRSCNRAQKTNSWCGKCPKCLFTFMALFPWIDNEILVEKIFGKNLFQEASLFSLLRAFVVDTDIKPFECVGTREESLVLLFLATQKYKGDSLPPLLASSQKEFLSREKDMFARSDRLFRVWNEEHFLPKIFSEPFFSFMKNV